MQPKQLTPKNFDILVEAVSDGWRLTLPVEYIVFKKTWVVPEGFVTDFASIPRVFWGIYPPWREDYGPAAVLHDFLRRRKKVPKKEADLIFREVMKQNGVSFLTRHIFYRAVRGFAW